MNVIVYSLGVVGCAVAAAAPASSLLPVFVSGAWVQPEAQDIDYTALAAKIVPQGAVHVVVDQASLPASDPATWKIVDGAILVDADGLKVSLRAYAATKRYAIETGGIVVAGASIATDRESQAMINGAYTATVMESGFTTQWKGADGTWAALNAAAISAIASAVKDHVAASFAAEKTVDDAITAGTIMTAAQIDAASWPSNG